MQLSIKIKGPGFYDNFNVQVTITASTQGIVFKAIKIPKLHR